MAVDFVVSIGSKIAEYLIQPIGRQFGYVIYYKSNLESLKNEVRKLEEKRGAVQLLVDHEENGKGKVIGPDVRGWLHRVAEHSKVAKSILGADDTEANKKCMDGWWCPNLKSRHSLSRKAKKKVEEVAKLLLECGNFPTRVAYSPPPPGIECRPIQGIRGFESRRLKAEEVMDALKDVRVNMIGICGMGGVGKTTMVKEVAKKAKEQNLFDDVVMAVVSQTPEVRKIQDEIADLLGFEFRQESESGRADALRERLKKNKKRILVVLDDVWKRIELNVIGIPFGDAHEHCKILLTSRSDEVCNDMNTDQNIQVGVLHEEEARNLFKEMAGISIDRDLHSTQMEVVKECGGLPLAIVTVGRALKGKDKPSWDSALEQLRKGIGKNIRGVETEVFKSLELSYNFIESEEAKKCFLLCSLYPEDSYIPIDDLVKFGIGLELFEGIDSVGGARDRVHDHLDHLIKCYLLMHSGKDGFVKMHDVIRDVSISIASREENSFMVRCDEALKEWPEHDRRKNYAVISMRFSEMRGGIPDNLKFPKLQLLRLDFGKNFFIEASENWYQGMEQLKAVALSRMFTRSLPKSLRCLTNLQTLSLRDCKLVDQDVSAIGTLKNLEILSFVGSNIKELPREIGNLTRLKLLDLLRCRVKRIPYGVLSSLSKLEELSLGKSFTGWDVVVQGEEISTNACVSELASLPNLVALAIYVPESKFWVWPKGVAVLQKVKTFDVRVGEKRWFEDFDRSYRLSNRLVLKSLHISGDKDSELKRLLKSAIYLELRSVTGVRKMLCDLDYEGGFELLTELTLAACSGLEGLIDTTNGRLAKEAFSALKVLQLFNLHELTHLWKGPTHHHECLRNLTRVKIVDCEKLESVFSLSVVRKLVQLQELGIQVAQMLTEVIVSDGGREDDEIGPATLARIEFPKLTKLKLYTLPNFTAFSKAMNPIELPRLEILELGDNPMLDCLYPAFSKDALSRIETLEISFMDNLIQIWPGDLQANLRTITLRYCHKLVNILLPSNLIKCMQNLVELRVKACQSLEVAFDIGGLNVGEGQGAIALPFLATLVLHNLRNLTHVWANYSPGIQGFQNLTFLMVIKCNSLRILFSSSVAKLLVMLRELRIKECAVMEAVIAWEQVDAEVTTNTIVFPQLTTIELKDLPNLTSFCHQAYTVEGDDDEIVPATVDRIEFPKLTTLRLIDLPNFAASSSKAMNPIELPQLEILALQQIPKLHCLCPASEGNYDTNRPLFNNKDALSRIETLDIAGMDNLIQIWPGDLQANLRIIWLERCHKLLNVLLPSNLIKCMQNLVHLYVARCESLEVVFDIGGLNVGEGQGAIALPCLANLSLFGLQNLTHVWANYSPGIQGFQNLTFLKIGGCHSLRILFSPSVAKLLVRLKELEITACGGMEAVIAWEQEVDAEVTTNTIVFPQLTMVKLKGLPNLTSFCPQAYMVEGSFLQKVEVFDCPKMMALPLAFQRVIDKAKHVIDEAME